MQNQEFLQLRQRIIENDFSNLNNMQKKAVFSTEGPLLVLAGAGSGKTTVLVNRIANMIKYGCAYDSDEVSSFADDETIENMKAYLAGDVSVYPRIAQFMSVNPVMPWQVLAITFTNKAAGELKERLEKMLGQDSSEIWAMTFHSSCVRILRRHAALLGYTTNFTIYDTDDSKRVIKNCMKDEGINEKLIAPKVIMSEISSAKNSMISPEEYYDTYCNDLMRRNIGIIYRAYQKSLKASDAMDFDDLIVNTVELFRANPEVLQYYQNKFKYILVDEYQDTNHIQYLLVSMLAAKYRNICVVGDDDQSIYRFRGATIENILSFEEQYSNTKVIRLEQNYRSTQNILDAANSVISNNQNRKGKNLWTDNGKGDLILHHLADTDMDEGTYIASHILEGYKQGKKYSDFAVLYRLNSQSNMIEQSFVRTAIPYRIIGGHKFYDRKEIKDALAYLSVVVNPNDSVRLSRIINEPKRGIGEASLNYVMEISAGLGLGVFDVIRTADEYPKLSRSAAKFKEFAVLIDSYIEMAETSKPSDVLKYILSTSGYVFSLDNEPDRKADRLENLDQLLNNMINFEELNEECTINDFLQDVALMTDIDNYNADVDSVVLMTIHSAKGLEFPTVFLAGMEEGIFPSDMALQEGPAGLEEERRLAYVGITRAKEKLYISSCYSRMLFGSTRFNPVSRFVKEIPQNLVEHSKENQRKIYDYQHSSAAKQGNNTFATKGTIPHTSGTSSIQNGGFSNTKVTSPVTGISYKAGDTVKHKAFGQGVILSCTPAGNDTLLEVAFTTAGTKKMMANYAKLEKI